MNSTARRVPLTTGFPARILGSRDMRSCQLAIGPIMWAMKIYLLGWRIKDASSTAGSRPQACCRLARRLAQGRKTASAC